MSDIRRKIDSQFAAVLKAGRIPEEK
jgi:hypothetical protein